AGEDLVAAVAEQVAGQDVARGVVVGPGVVAVVGRVGRDRRLRPGAVGVDGPRDQVVEDVVGEGLLAQDDAARGIRGRVHQAVAVVVLVGGVLPGGGHRAADEVAFGVVGVGVGVVRQDLVVGADDVAAAGAVAVGVVAVALVGLAGVVGRGQLARVVVGVR